MARPLLDRRTIARERGWQTQPWRTLYPTQMQQGYWTIAHVLIHASLIPATQAARFGKHHLVDSTDEPQFWPITRPPRWTPYGLDAPDIIHGCHDDAKCSHTRSDISIKRSIGAQIARWQITRLKRQHYPYPAPSRRRARGPKPKARTPTVTKWNKKTSL